MKIVVTGFNIFHQWPSMHPVIKKFTLMELPQFITAETELLLLGWSYNVLRIHNKIYFSGLYEREYHHNEIQLPIESNNTTEVAITGNDRHLLLLDKTKQTIWRTILGETPVWVWKQIPLFWSVETSTQNSMRKIECNIVAVKAGCNMNLCLSAEGHVYDIPRRINTSQCTGKIISIDCGYEHAIILSDAGNVYTWGNGRRCQLGHGDLNNVEEPELVEALAGVKIVRVRAGGWHSCALSDTGDLYTWGWNQAGQLGLNEVENPNEDTSLHLKISRNYIEDTVTSTAVPTLVDIFEKETSEIPLDCNIIDVACGSKHTAVLLSDYSVWMSGSNAYCQLGMDSEEVPHSKYFKKVHVEGSKCSVLCGPWSTVIMSET